MNEAPAKLIAALADRYRIERGIGEGGMATVYLAHDLRHDRKVAIKLLRPELAAVIGAERFLAEIRTTANLQHPHILGLHDSGEVGGSVFYVMPFVEGESLRGRLEREKQLPVHEAVRIVSEVAQALDYAHRHGVIHRDIKPENILLHDGRALVADFGIALAATSAGKRMTETGMSLGTPTYMSPEQAMGERTLDARTDVYALGCVLYELLVGAPPFTGPTAQAIVAKVLTERAVPPSTARETVPAALDDVVLIALSKVPADRFATAALFAEALSASLAGGTGRTVSGARWAPAAAKERGRPMRGGLLAGIAIGAVAMAVAALVANAVRGGAAAGAEVRTQLTFDGRSYQPAISPDGKFVAYVLTLCSESPEAECRMSLLVREEGNARPVPIVENALRVLSPRWSRDGSSLLFSAEFDDGRAGIFIAPRLGGVPRLVTREVRWFSVHPQADSLMILGDDRAMVIDIATGAVGDTVQLGSRSIAAIEWSPDGRRIAAASSYASLWMFGRDGVLLDSLIGTFRPSVRWDAAGSAVIVFVAQEGKEDNLTRYGVDGAGRIARTPEVLLTKESALLVGEFDVAAATGRIAMTGGTLLTDYWTFDLGREGSGRRATTGTAYYGTPSISPDGRRIYFVRGDALGDNLYVLTPEGAEEALTVERYPAASEHFAVSSDGRRVLFGHSVAGGARASVMRLPSREVVHGETHLREFEDAQPFGAEGVVVVAADLRSLVVFDSMNAASREIALPDSLRLRSIAAGPGADAVMAVVVDATTQRAIIGRLSLVGGAFTPRWTFPEGERPASLSWRADGSVWFLRWPPGDPVASLYELSPGSGPPVRRMTLPPLCNEMLAAVAHVAPRGVCVSADRRGDVWVVDLP